MARSLNDSIVDLYISEAQLLIQDCSGQSKEKDEKREQARRLLSELDKDVQSALLFLPPYDHRQYRDVRNNILISLILSN